MGYLIHLGCSLVARVQNWVRIAGIGFFLYPRTIRVHVLRGAFAETTIPFRFRSGARVTCRRGEFPGVIEVFVLEEYGAAAAALQSADVVIDVGANVGAATVWFAQVFPESRVLAIEPSPDALALLRYNVTQNDLTSRVTVIPCAVASAVGHALFDRYGPSVERRLVGPEAGANAISVPTVTLQSLLDEVEPGAQVVVKLDCEGAEWDILEATPRSSLARAALYIGEYHMTTGRSADELVAAFEFAGYHCETWPHPRQSDLGTFLARA